MRKMLFITLLMGGLCTTVSVAKAQERLPEYLQAEKYTQEKLNTMLFSTAVDPVSYTHLDVYKRQVQW